MPESKSALPSNWLEQQRREVPGLEEQEGRKASMGDGARKEAELSEASVCFCRGWERPTRRKLLEPPPQKDPLSTGTEDFQEHPLGARWQ